MCETTVVASPQRLKHPNVVSSLGSWSSCVIFCIGGASLSPNFSSFYMEFSGNFQGFSSLVKYHSVILLFIPSYYILYITMNMYIFVSYYTISIYIMFNILTYTTCIGTYIHHTSIYNYIYTWPEALSFQKSMVIFWGHPCGILPTLSWPRSSLGQRDGVLRRLTSKSSWWSHPVCWAYTHVLGIRILFGEGRLSDLWTHLWHLVTKKPQSISRFYHQLHHASVEGPTCARWGPSDLVGQFSTSIWARKLKGMVARVTICRHEVRQGLCGSTRVVRCCWTIGSVFFFKNILVLPKKTHEVIL